MGLQYFRGVQLAMKMPSRMLKKECAGILESMKVLVLFLSIFMVCIHFASF